MIFKLFESTASTYTYLLVESTTNEALIIDPAVETVERDAKLIQQLGLKLRYAGFNNSDSVEKRIFDFL